MKYTAWELRKMNGRRCKLKCKNRPEEEGEIYVDDWIVSFLSRSCENSDHKLENSGYPYFWIIHTISCSDDSYSKQYDSITFLDEQNIKEQHQNIYYDDNWEEIKEWDRVLVGEDKLKRIFLWKIPRAIWNYFYLSEWEESVYRNTIYDVSALTTNICIKYKDGKKLRELMLTDEEYEEVKNKYK